MEREGQMTLSARLIRKQIWMLLTGLIFGLLLTACQGPAWEDAPNVQAARIACAGLRKSEHYVCIEEQAAARLDPDVCHLAGAGLDDLCLQAVYEAADDPAICDRLYLKGTDANCREWVAQPEPKPRLREERRPPTGDYLSLCAAETVRQEAAFRTALSGEEQSFATLCQKLGLPDWETGEEPLIFIYELTDGAEIRLGFRTLDQLSSAFLITADRQQIDLLPSR